MFAGIDLGTSAVKAVIIDEHDRLLAQASAPLAVSRPETLWSEQDAEDWWAATDTAMASLATGHPDLVSGIECIGLSGQMHGATLLDASERPLRPAILWNDGRSGAECLALEAAVPDSRAITGNLAMPGFTAPKLAWVRAHEPECFAKVAHVLLPKDYLRLRMTGERASDLSDASGTLWLDVAKRAWSDTMLAACDLGTDAMPELYEGTEVTGQLLAEVAARWGCQRVPVVAGGGDQAAGAVGAGVVRPGEASLSLGTSGVYFVSDRSFKPNPDQAVHAFCHALPGTWHQMSVILSAASCLRWVTRLVGASNEASLLAEIEAADAGHDRLLFLPYLSGERTPHNDPHATGVFMGLDHDCDRATLGRAVLEGVAFAFADAQDALLAGGARIDGVSVIGGGARSHYWGRILASALGRTLTYREGGEVGPALGAARLARIGVTGDDPHHVCRPLPVDRKIEPDATLAERYSERIAAFRDLYARLRDIPTER
jgi:xylulokinase